MEDSFYDETLDNLQALQQGEYENCSITNCLIPNTDLSGYKFIDCQFIDCDLSMCKLNKTALRNVTFTRCKLIGLKFDTCHEFLLSFSFDTCTLDFSYFSQINISKTVFKECQIIEADFTQCALEEVSFKKTNLDRCIFNQTNLQRADLSTAYNFEIDPNLNDLKGATFSKENVHGLLTQYRIEIV